MSNGTIAFNKKCIPSPEYVVLKCLNRYDDMKMNGILLSENVFSNDRLGFYKVISIGDKAAEEYGIKEGDYVIADRLAQCYKTFPISVMKYINIIAKTNEDNSKFYPLRNMVFVQDEIGTTQNVGGILINNYNKSIKTGKIVSMNIDDDVNVPYKVGDTVMISKGPDSLQIGSTHIFIYKHDMIVCRVDEEEYEEETVNAN